MRIDTVEARLLKQEDIFNDMINNNKIMRCATCKSEDVYIYDNELICASCGAIESIDLIIEQDE